MKRSKHGWTPDDLDRLYTSFGFRKRQGGKHIIYDHPELPPPHNRATVRRAAPLPVGYIETTLELLDRLDECRRAKSGIK
ncbi:MAG: hypothetical protein M3Q03_12990 [Chloroflexota bacterium]|nr:hypothetical protein [Chloroflexota bacterium]